MRWGWFVGGRVVDGAVPDVVESGCPLCEGSVVFASFCGASGVGLVTFVNDDDEDFSNDVHGAFVVVTRIILRGMGSNFDNFPLLVHDVQQVTQFGGGNSV